MKTENIEYGTCSSDDWGALIKKMCSGQKIKIHESVYYYFLEVLPPKRMFDGGFWFAEGVEKIKQFTHEKGGYFVRQLRRVAPLE